MTANALSLRGAERRSNLAAHLSRPCCAMPRCANERPCAAAVGAAQNQKKHAAGTSAQRGKQMTVILDDEVADLRRKLDECRAERDAALAGEAALAEVLDTINRSPGDPGPVFEAILEKAHSLCGAATGGLVTYDGEHFRAVATHGYPEEYAAMLRRPFLPTVNHQRLLDGERFVYFADRKAVDLGSDHEITRGTVELSGVRTQLMMPLRKDGA